jgi:hypothetical protein
MVLHRLLCKIHENRGGFLPDPGWLGGAVWELKRAILSTYGHGCDRAARTVNRSTACTLLSLMKRVRGGDVVISFNYDTLIEQLARKLRLRLRHGTGPALRNEVRFVKPPWLDYVAGARNSPACLRATPVGLPHRAERSVWMLEH